MRTSGWPNVACSEAIVMSHARVYQNPPPSAQPLTAAMTGLSSSMMCMTLSVCAMSVDIHCASAALCVFGGTRSRPRS